MHPTNPSRLILVDTPAGHNWLQAKFSRSGITTNVIPRHRLLDRLNAGLSGKATLLCAPAGFGMTTLLVEWLETIERQVAWLKLDEIDNELVIFVQLLADALQTIVPTAGHAITGPFYAPQVTSLQKCKRQANSGNIHKKLVIMLVNYLADVSEEIVLVFDDYHFIRNRDVHTMIELLIQHLPPPVHLVLATRFDPPLPLVKWKAQGSLNELRGADLRFTFEETETFLTHILRNDLAHKAAFVLAEQTEGWIALLSMAALSLRNAPDLATFMERLRHFPNQAISSYMLEEIFTPQA